MKTIVIPNISENPENWKILHQCAFSSFCKTSLILSELLQFKSIWCPSGKNFAFSSNPPCKLQASKFSFVSFLLVLHSPFTCIFYNMEDQMHCLEYRLLRRQVRWSGIPISLRIFHSLLWSHTVKGFRIVNEADVFLELSCFFDDPADVGKFISGSSAFSKTSLNIRKFTVHILLKPGLENFEHYVTSMWDECNCAVVWAFFGIAFLWDWNENWPFPVLWSLLSVPNLLAYWVQHFHSIIFQDLE